MLSNGQAIALLYLCAVAIFYVAFKRSRTESQNLALLKAKGELKAPRWMVVFLFVVISLYTFIFSLIKDETWPLALAGPLFGLYMLSTTFFGYRFTETSIYYGWRFQHVVAYSRIAKLDRILGYKNTTVFIMTLKSGEERRIGNNIPCEDVFIEELHRRSGCDVYYRGPGNQFTKKA